jgi:hypothetical protein
MEFESIHLFLVRIHGHEKVSALDLPEPIGMTVPNSKPRHWLASNPFDPNLSTGCYLRIELQPRMPPAKESACRLLGPKRTWPDVRLKSAFRGEADMPCWAGHVCKRPLADMEGSRALKNQN